MKITPELVKQLMPDAIKWVRDCERFIMQHGRELDPAEAAEASLAGVAFPKNIRVCFVPHIPRPSDGLLGVANQAIGLVTDSTGGLTLNYGIFVRLDCERDRALLFHEFVHVGQYERFGGVEGFLPRYLDECVRFGYLNAPLERQAIDATARHRNG